MLHDRTGHTATLLADGRVLIVGGDTGLRSAEVWDPTTQSFKRSRSLATGRYGHTTTLLRDGRVLVVGGTNQTSAYQRVTEETLSSAELRDPGTGLFTSVGSLAHARTGHAATFMPDGRILLLGGDGINGALATAELWDPEDFTFAPTTPLVEARTDFTATLLQDGRVLVVGGLGDAGDDQVVLASVELWDAPPASP